MVAATQQKVKGPRRKIEATCDLTPPETRRRLCAAIGSMTGWYTISLLPRRNTRSLRQNAYYWSCCVQPFYEFLREQGAVSCMDESHEFIKDKHLRVPIINKDSGEVIGWRTRSTTELDTAEFSEFVEQTRDWLLDVFGIITPDAGEDYQ